MVVKSMTCVFVSLFNNEKHRYPVEQWPETRPVVGRSRSFEPICPE